MPRITASLSNSLYVKIQEISMSNHDSLSNTLTKLAEVGLLVHEKQQGKSDGKATSDIEEYCYKLIIESHGLLRIIAREKHNINEETLDNLRHATLSLFKQKSGVSDNDLF